MKSETPADRWRSTLRAELMAARKARSTSQVSALRSVLAAIDNAETPEHVQVTATSDTVAGAVSGLGATEVARKVLTDEEIRALVFAEIDERRSAARQLPSSHAARADQLLAEAQHLVDVAYRSA